MNKPIIEACVDSFESCQIAYDNKADRLELCSNLIIGGTTPSISLFKQVKKAFDIKINVLIRPRFGDFHYGEKEIEQMCDEISMFRELGANGIVIGALTKDGKLDEKTLVRFMSNIDNNMEVTLHRAFDMTENPCIALETAISLGINTILTSGQAQTAIEGINLLKKLNDTAKGRIDIMAGAGVNKENILKINQQSGIKTFHTSAKKTPIQSEMIYRKKDISMGLKELSEYEILRTDAAEFRACADLVHSLI